MYADWTDRIARGEMPAAAPPRPQGRERNIVITMWDYGTPTPPTNNLAPNGDAFGHDPHGFGRGNTLLLDQITSFLTTGVIPNECGAAACQSQTP